MFVLGLVELGRVVLEAWLYMISDNFLTVQVIWARLDNISNIQFSGTSKLIYLYGPIVILCVANMIFFTLTAIKIARIKKDTEMLRSKDSSTHDQDRKDTQRYVFVTAN